MGEDDPGAAMLGGVGDDITQREAGSGFVPFVAREVQAPSLLVDVRNPEKFTPRVAIGDTASEESPGRGEPVELEWKFGTLIAHANSLGCGCFSAHSRRIRNDAKVDVVTFGWTAADQRLG